MSEFIIKKASKKAKKLRIGFSGPSGFGKTYSALLTAYGLTDNWEKICVIDTERDSASLYSDLGDFNTLALNAPFHPNRYIAALKAVEKSGCEVVIIDSIAHEWAGRGGCLDIHNNLGGRFQDWGIVTPLHNDFIDSILTSSIHVFTTVRTKQGYDMVNSGQGVKVQKVGMQEVTRDGFEYELDVNFTIINDNHLAQASKDRTNIFDKRDPFIISVETGKELKKWASAGRSNLDEAMDLIRKADSETALRTVFATYKSELSDNKDFITHIAKKKKELSELSKIGTKVNETE